MARFNYDIGIVGGGAAGLSVASGAARLGAKTLLIEKETALGGDCLHYGCVPSKTLLKSAHLYHQMQQANDFGLPRSDLPPVDFKFVRRRIKNVIAEIQKHDAIERFTGLGVNVVLGAARFTDPHTVQVNGRPYDARKWVIATGSRAAVPPIPGLAQARFLTHRNLFSLDHLPGSMIFLGAGPVGIEMAQAFNRLGATVSVIDRAEQILTNDDPDLAGELQTILAAEGIDFYPGREITRVTDDGRQCVVDCLDSAGEKDRLSAKTLVVALGRQPNIEELNLAAIGVTIDAQGIRVDRRLRTSQKHIFAAGDVIGGYQFTHAAGYEAGIVVSNAILHLPRKVNYRFMPWCTYTSPELASIGMNEKAARAAGVRYTVYRQPFAANDRARAEGQPAGMAKLLLDRRQRPIGVQMLGMHAGDLIAEWVATLNGGVKLATLAGAIHPYPSLGEINKSVVNRFLGPRLFSRSVKMVLKGAFGLRGAAEKDGVS